MVAISVVVATLESPEDTDVMQALEAQSFTDYEVLFRDEYPVTKARNAGVSAAASDKIVFLDDDSRPRPGYLRQAAALLETEAAYAGRTVHPRDDVFAEHFTGHYDWGDDPRYVDHFWGCNMGVRREVFGAVGGWDEQMGWGHEEKELAARVRTEFQIRYDPSLVVDHPYASSVADYWKKQYNLETQSPYLWRKRGHSPVEQVRRVVVDLLDPRNYVRRTPLASVTQAGATLARAAGRVRGLVTDDRTPGQRSGLAEGDRRTVDTDAPADR